jgi:hypothetical protein
MFLSKTSFDPNMAGRGERGVTQFTRESHSGNVGDRIYSEKRHKSDRLRLIRAYFKVDDRAIKTCLISIAEQLANGQPPIVAFGPKIEKRRRVRKSKTLSLIKYPGWTRRVSRNARLRCRGRRLAAVMWLRTPRLPPSPSASRDDGPWTMAPWCRFINPSDGIADGRRR